MFKSDGRLCMFKIFKTQYAPFRQRLPEDNKKKQFYHPLLLLLLLVFHHEVSI